MRVCNSKSFPLPSTIIVVAVTCNWLVLINVSCDGWYVVIPVSIAPESDNWPVPVCPCYWPIKKVFTGIDSLSISNSLLSDFIASSPVGISYDILIPCC